jgi:hypothetical protein
MRYERTFQFPGAAGTVLLRIEEGGAGCFRMVVSTPERQDGEVTISIPTEQADLLANAIGHAADASGE